jgi:hypothetical protein
VPELARTPAEALTLAAEPVRLTALADGTRLVATAIGLIHVVPAGGPIASIDLSARVEHLSDLAVAPDYATSGALFVAYRPTDARAVLRVARVVVDPESFALRPDAEQGVLEARTDFGGALAFDDQGMLFIVLGDAPSAERTDAAQDPSDLRGKVLRVDVRPIGDDGGYYQIPDDNPFIEGSGARTARWASGIRDPHGCHYDAVGASLWCVDRGESSDEIHRIEARANLGWPYREGYGCRSEGDPRCESREFTGPRAVIAHEDEAHEDCAVTGGAVDRSARDAIAGLYVYTTTCGEIRGLLTAPGVSGYAMDQPVAEMPASDVGGAGVPGGVVGLDADGGVVVAHATGIDRLDLADPSPFPTKLSESGCFASLSPLAPGPDLYAYDVNAALWTDGSVKTRFVVVPPGATIASGPSPEGPGPFDPGPLDSGWEGLAFPPGSVVIKVFAYERPDGSGTQPAETRVMVRGSYEWRFHTYRWDDAGIDAELMRGGAEAVVATRDAEGEPVDVSHYFPDRYGCAICHGFRPPTLLGLRADQLAGHGDVRPAWHTIGLAEPPAAVDRPLVDYHDATAPIEKRARAYLHTNCGHCHRPGGWVPTSLGMDLRWTTPFADMNLCGVRATTRTLADTRIAPGDPDGSLVFARMETRGIDQMPPVGTSIVDPVGVDVLRQWIADLSDCDPASP